MAKSAKSPGIKSFYQILEDNSLDAKTAAAELIRISDIAPREQPRKTFEREALETLAESIATHGVLQPIVVRESSVVSGMYEIIAGERRWRAARMAGLSDIPAVIFSGDDLKAAQVALIENIQREDLNPVEEAMGYDSLIEKFGLTQDEVAKQVGKSRSTVTNMLRLLALPDEVLDLLKDKELSMGHARALLGLENEEDMLPLAQRTINNRLSVREVEAAVKRINDAANREIKPAEEKVTSQVKLHMKELERKAMSSLGRRVRISRSARKKVVELAYDDDADLEALLVALCGNDIFSE